MSPPILFLVFNRPDTTALVFEAIRAAQPARLYVAADGSRADFEGEAERCAEVRKISTAVDWPCEVKTLFRDHNLGCRRAVSGAISWFFEHEEEGIILEDDCLPDASFFSYCAALLERYRDDERIMCITGDNFQADMGSWPHSYYYSIFNHCWGWASWRRAWDLYDAELREFDREVATRDLNRLSRVRGFGTHWSQIFDQVKDGKIDSWAYVWTWSCFQRGGLTCTPRVNLVSNIGFGKLGTHTKGASSPFANMATEPLLPPYKAPQDVEAALRFDDYVTTSHFGINYPSLLARVLRKSKSLIKRVFSVQLARES